MQSHPAAELFPMMGGADLDALVADIREHGQREPIIVHEGLILDGRNRFRACQQLGIEPGMVEWDRSGEPPEAFVISMNLHRRHLNESQRGMIAAKLATRTKLESLKNVGPKVEDGIHTSSRSVPEAAEMLNVSRDTVFKAKKIWREGTPEEIAAVEGGKAAVHAIAKELRRGQPPEKRKVARGQKNDESLADKGKNPERIERMRAEADIWANVSNALNALTSLPHPSDVAAILRKNPSRVQVVDQRLPRSLNYLKELNDVWNQ